MENVLLNVKRTSLWGRGAEDARKGLDPDSLLVYEPGYLNGWKFVTGVDPALPPDDDYDDNYCPHCGRSD